MKNHKLNLAKGHEIITSNSLNYSSIEQEAVRQQNRMQYQMSWVWSNRNKNESTPANSL